MSLFLQPMGAVFFFVLACLFFAFCALLSVAYWRREKRERNRRDRWRADIADISILFQTMRDVISQQKTLAREFNEELDTKMSLVKQVLRTSLEKNERIFEQQQQVSRALEESQAALQSLQRQTVHVRESLGPAAPEVLVPEPAPPGEPRVPPVEATLEDGPKSFVSFDTEAAREPTEDALEGTGLTGASYAKWEGLDFDAGPAPAEETLPEPKEVFVPQAPEDAEAARQAFRALLDIGGADNAPTPITPGLPDAPDGGAAWDKVTDAALKTADGNGRGAKAPLRQRVLEYHGAGMTVPDISRELGVSKGEIRLMLSLAKQHGA